MRKWRGQQRQAQMEEDRKKLQSPPFPALKVLCLPPWRSERETEQSLQSMMLSPWWHPAKAARRKDTTFMGSYLQNTDVLAEEKEKASLYEETVLVIGRQTGL